MTNEEIILGLNDIARGVAMDFLGRFPEAIFTSGRRDIADQARAMAQNVVGTANRSGNPTWIRATYVETPLSRTLQECVDELSAIECPSQDDLTQAFENILKLSLPPELRTVSWHMSGDAFDVQPTTELQEHADYLRQLVQARIVDGGAGKVLTMEGGLVRCHCQVA